MRCAYCSLISLDWTVHSVRQRDPRLAPSHSSSLLPSLVPSHSDAHDRGACQSTPLAHVARMHAGRAGGGHPVANDRLRALLGAVGAGGPVPCVAGRLAGAAARDGWAQAERRARRC
jgi:hypothetical protein